MALSDVILMLLFNFERLEHHHYQSNRKMNKPVSHKKVFNTSGPVAQDGFIDNGGTPVTQNWTVWLLNVMLVPADT